MNQNSKVDPAVLSSSQRKPQRVGTVPTSDRGFLGRLWFIFHNGDYVNKSLGFPNKTKNLPYSGGGT